MLRLPNGHLMKPMERPRTIIQVMPMILLLRVQPGPKRPIITSLHQYRSSMTAPMTIRLGHMMRILISARGHFPSRDGLSTPQPNQALILSWLAIAVRDLKSTWIQAGIFVLVSMMILPGHRMILPVQELPREAMPTVRGTMSKW